MTRNGVWIQNPTDMAQGIDMSHHQGAQFPWETLLERNPIRLQFAFIRASQGVFQDRQWQRNVAECERLDIPFGLYHYLREDVHPQRQAGLFAGIVRDQPLSLPAVLDVEQNLSGRRPTNAQVRAFYDTYHAACGHPLILYTSYSEWWASTGGAGWAANAGIGLWAHDARNKRPVLPIGWRNWLFWQYSISGRLAGYEGPLDLNRFNGSMVALRAQIGAWNQYRSDADEG